LSRFNPMLGNWLGMVWALGVGASLLVLVVGIALWPRLAIIRRDPASREYQRFCRRLARCRIPRGAAEAPEDYARRAIALRPDLGNDIKRITRLYLAARYGPEGGTTPRDLRDAVAAFRPARRPAAKLEPSQPT
ncbi:MAG: DUF4129 domain-containing protein, partial [Gammaproteobacteria bacterium]|nr:DUF4129 domain-containing protein [Gammaproteobacteria bacterium]